jgi:hypothetical protein
MKKLKTINELIEIIEEGNHRLKEFGLCGDSSVGQFPYRFSFSVVGDRFDAEFNEQEVWALSSGSKDAIELGFSMKMDPRRLVK